MRPLSTILPLPGVSEIEDIVRSLIRGLKDLKYEDEKQALLAARLENLIGCARQLDNRGELNSQLCDINSLFEAATKRTSRLGVSRVQRKLALWDELDSKINRIVETSMLQLVAQQQHQIERLTARPSENKLPVIPSYEITEQVQHPPRRACICIYIDLFLHGREPRMPREPCISCEPFTISHGTGRLGKLSVTYKRFAPRSDVSASSFVEEELAYMSRIIHPNVTALVGVMQGYLGLDGYIVATDGVSVGQFLMRSPSGSSFAKCFEGIQSVYEAYSDLKYDSISVRADGHVTVFPLRSSSSLSSWNADYVHPTALPGFCYKLVYKIDTAVDLLLSTYRNTYSYDPQRLQSFLEHCRDLGPGFTMLQFYSMAASCGVVPLSKSGCTEWGKAPSIILAPGCFCSIDLNTNIPRMLLGAGRCNGLSYNVMFDTEFGSLDLDPIQTDRLGSTSYDLSPYFSGESVYLEIECYPSQIGLRGSDWKEILTEAQGLSQALNIPFDTIAFCGSAFPKVSLNTGLESVNIEHTQNLYFHQKVDPDDQRSFWGFFSISSDPDCQVSREAIERRGWVTTHQVCFTTYNMSDEWNLQYERLLTEEMAKTPGSYPGAHVEEIV
ncbi:hypothetical protein BDV93DRAFT_602750 [Ceratobasidium sp. AG-I]|nr:hypothetical protein BDV93DRAFT_602750 [Ceratobasidium sp. AG-I]